VIPRTGYLRLTVESAHLNVNLGGPLNKMDPFVFIQVGKQQQWRSSVCVNGGKNPVWQFQHMEIPVKKLSKLEKVVRIEVRDQNLLGSEPIAHANVTLGMFASRGPVHERIQLIHRGMNGGHIMMRSVFHTETVAVV